MKNIYLLLLCAGVMVISSCADNGEIEQTFGSNLLQISTEITTRSVLESSSFSTGDEIGVLFQTAPVRNMQTVLLILKLLSISNGKWTSLLV